VASISRSAPIHLGLDVHKDTIPVGTLDPDQQVPDVERIAHDEPSVRRLVARFPDRARLRACDGAGPTGFELSGLPEVSARNPRAATVSCAARRSPASARACADGRRRAPGGRAPGC